MNSTKVNCFKCRYFKVTWNQKFPRACEAYGFKTKYVPSDDVLRISGNPCLQFAEKVIKK